MATPAANKPEEAKATKAAPNPAEKERDPRVHAAITAEWEQGFRGTEADPTPNENYTVAGVTDPKKSVPEEFKVRTGDVVLPDPNYGQK